MRYYPENSFSNEKFKIFNHNKRLIIRKYISENSEKNFFSLKKQNEFKKIFFKDFSVESIKCLTPLKNFKKKKYYDLPYKDGKNGFHILEKANVYEINLIRYWLKKNFFIKKKYKFIRIENHIFLDKLDDILKKIKKKIFLNKFSNNYIPKFRSFLKNKAIYYPNDLKCHGDLTLSNIIINQSQKKIFIFDFLKTYNDNIIQDYAKLYQEYKLGWSARYFEKKQKIRASIVYENIISNSDWQKLDKKIKKVLKVEVYMTLFRILPYINFKDKMTIRWIEKSIRKINLI